MRLLVAGASGFIGRNLLLKVPKKWNTVATYNKSADFLDFLQENTLNNVQPIKVDLINASETKEKIGNEFDCAVYLTANTSALLSVRNPEVDLRMNVLTLLNTVKAAKIKDLIFVSSGAVYGGNVGLVSHETPLKPSFPYAVSKLAAENYVLFFKRHHLIDEYVVVRFFGVYGPHEAPRKIFTKLVKAFNFDQKQEFTIVGDGNNFVDTLFVEDAVDAMLSVIGSDVRDVTVNTVSGNHKSVNDLAVNIAEIFGKKNIRLSHESWPIEYTAFYASSKDMETLYGFKSSTPLEAGIWRLAEWLEKQYA